MRNGPRPFTAPEHITPKGGQNQIENPKTHILDIFPQGDSLLEQYKTFTKPKSSNKEHLSVPDDHSIEVMRDVLYRILDEAIENSALQLSESTGSEFPYTVLNLEKIARAVLIKKGETLPSQLTTGEKSTEPRIKEEFLMTGIPMDVSAGGQLEWIEMAIGPLLEALPQAIADIRAGETPINYNFTILGYPTNEYGLVTDKLNESLHATGLSAMGDLYAEFIEQRIESLKKNKDAIVVLTGVSLGASIAAEAGEVLLKDEMVEQTKERTSPRLIVKMYAPAADTEMNASPFRGAQLAAGVGIQAIAYLADSKNKILRSEMPTFLKGLPTALEKKMLPQVDTEQLHAKKRALTLFKIAAMKGQAVSDGVKVTKIVGVHDPLVFSPKRYLELNSQRENSSSNSLLQSSTKNARVFGMEMAHSIPFDRSSLFGRFNRIVRTLDNPKNN